MEKEKVEENEKKVEVEEKIEEKNMSFGRGSVNCFFHHGEEFLAYNLLTVSFLYYLFGGIVL